MLYILVIIGFLGRILSPILEFYSASDQIYEHVALSIIFITVLIFPLIITKEIKADKRIVSIIFLSFCIRVLVMFFDLYCRDIFLLPNSGFDSEKFHLYALEFPNIDFMTNPFPFLIGIIYKYIFNHRLIGQFFNILISTYTLIITYKIFEELRIRYNLRIILMLLLGFLPNFVIISSLLLREPLNTFTLAVSLFYFIKWWKYNKLRYIFLAIVLSLFSALLHSGAIANTVGYLILFVLFNNSKREFTLNVKTVFLILFLTVGIGIFFATPSNPILAKFKGIDDIESLVGRTAAYTDGGSAYDVGGEVNSLGGLIVNTPIRMFYFLASPLPWDWRGAQDIIAFMFSSTVYLYIMWQGIYKLFLKKSKLEDRKIAIVIFIFCLLSAAIFAWGTANAGTALRHRDKFIINYIVLLALLANKNVYCKREVQYE